MARPHVRHAVAIQPVDISPLLLSQPRRTRPVTSRGVPLPQPVNDERVASATPLHRSLGRLLSLTPAEVLLLNNLQKTRYRVRRDQDVVVHGYKYDSLFVLNDGVAIRYNVTHDGRRQIANFVLPGDLIGFPVCLFENAICSISMLTDASVTAIPLERVHMLFRESPRLAEAMFWQAARETAMYVEHIVNIGRRPAYERVAHLLLELLHRLQIIGMATPRSFELPLTQEVIADALGLSVVHVNRTFRRLREGGLLNVEDGRFVFMDVEALSRLAGFDGSYLARVPIPGLFALDMH